MNKRKLAIIISSVAAAVIAVTLAIVLPLTLTKNKGKPISQTAQSFVNLVMRIKTPITLDSEAEIEAGYVLYAHLGDEEKENSAVKEHKEILDGYKNEYSVLRAAADEEETSAKQAVLREKFLNSVSVIPSVKNITSENKESARAGVDSALALYEQLNEASRAETSVKNAYERLVKADEAVTKIEYDDMMAEISAAATEFIDGVEAIGEVTLDSINDIEDLLYGYEGFSDEVKAYEGVAEAKQTLDAALIKYQELKDEDDVKTYKALAQSLSPVESAVTLESERDISKAESLYEEMSEKAKSAAGVAEAKSVIEAAREKYNELFAIAEAERVRAFVEAANAVPADIENVDINWFGVLDAARAAYSALEAYESYNLPEVEEAFNRWNAAQIEFDKKGYEQIPMTDPNVLFSGHLVNPLLVLQNDARMIDPLKEFYNVSSTRDLSQYVIVWLNVYVDGVYVGRGELPAYVLGHEIAESNIKQVLSEISQTDGRVVSGGSFAFSINFEDRENEYIPSVKTKVSAAKPYTW